MRWTRASHTCEEQVLSKRQAGIIWREAVLPEVLFGQFTAAIEAADQRPEVAAMGLQNGYHPPILTRGSFWASVLDSAYCGRRTQRRLPLPLSQAVRYQVPDDPDVHQRR
jgi:hypothetical protein